ncbi:MAG: monofunctional biosynthetic peptidoglycan transglycosylase [Chitinivibrionales bacterium]|nr:monofunctional biosynthetic peptidoglycan transglycosylase [Chitinivibrionales bacterium]
MKILHLLWKILVGTLLLYAVLFSLGLTAVIVWAGITIAAPIQQVRRLVNENPVETAYMHTYRRYVHGAGKTDSITPLFVPLDSIAKALPEAVIAAEDDGFYAHPGFDLAAILDAYEYNRQHGKIKRGASTITQQLAKNLFLSGEKSYSRKYKEFAYTLLMEHFLGKKRILELYLNYAQFGPDLFGCEAAARSYFNKSSKYLSMQQATLLAAALASPGKLNPRRPDSAFMRQRIAVIGNNLYHQGYLNDSSYKNLTGDNPPKDSLTNQTRARGNVAENDSD